MKTAGLMALWRNPQWEDNLKDLLTYCDKVFLQFDIRHGDQSIPERAKILCGDKLEILLIVNSPWDRANWRERLLRLLDDYKPDVVLFPDEDERYGKWFMYDLEDFIESDKKYMMFDYRAPSTDDGRIVNNNEPYPALPHMKAFKWEPNLTYYPYPTLARLASYGVEFEYKAKTKLFHYCFYTKEEEARHIQTTGQRMQYSRTK